MVESFFAAGMSMFLDIEIGMVGPDETRERRLMAADDGSVLRAVVDEDPSSARGESLLMSLSSSSRSEERRVGKEC